MLRIALLFILVAAAAGAGAQSIYRWKDSAGQVHYTSDPPPGIAAGKVRVLMYATSWCPYCAKARAYFGKKGIAYAEYDVERSAAANAEFKRLGGRGVPLILVGREKMSGFSERGFDALLARASR
jgi:glutaredoxin